MRILVTAGATQEPIDGVRFLTNFSTGYTGAKLAEFFVRQGHSVVFVHGSLCKLPAVQTENYRYGSFKDLNGLLQQLLKTEFFELVVHAAAISDYSVHHIELNGIAHSPEEVSKIDSADELVIKTRRNFKIISRLKDYAAMNPHATTPPLLIGFKLTNSADPVCRRNAVKQLTAIAQVDGVVHNDLQDIQAGNNRPYSVFSNGELVKESLSMLELSDFIITMGETFHDFNP